MSVRHSSKARVESCALPPPRHRQGVAIVGVALMTGDALLTSAVSVTSAVEGIGLEARPPLYLTTA